MLKRLYEMAFLSARFFTIAIRKKSDESVVDRARFTPQLIFPATVEKWSADPMLLDYEDRTFMFYEAVNSRKGSIEAVEIFDDCSVSKPVTVADEEYHMSYPFVFKLKNKLFMIPETSEINEVRLYSCKSFPDKWEFSKTLLYGKYVDTTVHVIEDGMLMLTYKLSGNSERVFPEAYRVEKDWNLTRLKWNGADELNVRGAGCIFEKNGDLYRAAQSSAERVYGNGIVFYRLNLQETEYCEEKVGELKNDGILARGIWHDGLHSYSVSEKFEAIDIRCREFDATKMIRKVFR